MVSPRVKAEKSEMVDVGHGPNQGMAVLLSVCLSIAVTLRKREKKTLLNTMGTNKSGATWVQTWETTGAISGLRRILAPEEREIPPPAPSSSFRLGIKCFSLNPRQALLARVGRRVPTTTIQSRGLWFHGYFQLFSQRTLFWFVDQQCKQMHQPSPKIDYSCCARPRNKYSKPFLDAAQSCECTS